MAVQFRHAAPRLESQLKPYYNDERAGIQIFNCDCRDVLASLEVKVDLVLTDPPYGINYSTNHRKRIVAEHKKDMSNLLRSGISNDTHATTIELLRDTAELIEPLLCDTSGLYWFTSPCMLDHVLPVLRKWDVANILAWDKCNCSAGDLDTTYGRQWEAIVYARKGKPNLIGCRDRDVLSVSRGNVSGYLHPTQKPVRLLRYLIGRHMPDIVLDPFMGSGTTLRAAKDLGVRAIGVEIDESYCEIAAKRLSQEVLFSRDDHEQDVISQLELIA